MHNNTLTFAGSTPHSHIAIVDTERYEAIAHFEVAKCQLWSFIEEVKPLELKIVLHNKTVLHFVSVRSYERLRGLRLDRIEASPSALPMMPEYFLETRLKPDVTPDEGIIYRARGEYGGNEPILGFANEGEVDG